MLEMLFQISALVILFTLLSIFIMVKRDRLLKLLKKETVSVEIQSKFDTFSLIIFYGVIILWLFAGYINFRLLSMQTELTHELNANGIITLKEDTNRLKLEHEELKTKLAEIKEEYVELQKQAALSTK